MCDPEREDLMSNEVDLAKLTEQVTQTTIRRLREAGLLKGAGSSASRQFVQLRERKGTGPSGASETEDLESLTKAFIDIGLTEAQAKIAARGGVGTGDALTDAFLDVGLTEAQAKIAARGYE